MCMLFVYINDGSEKNSVYKMVLISNRDENWLRPTESANFRGDSQSWIGDGAMIILTTKQPELETIIAALVVTVNPVLGIDLEPGREGGTWLGMSKQGKVAVLLNILAVQELDKKGRGSLVTNFVTNTDITCEEYFDSLSSDKEHYNPFQLVLIDLREQNPAFHYLNNVESEPENSRKILQQDIFAVDNSVNSCNIPWCKTQVGKKRFQELLQENSDIQSKDVLVDKLLDLLHDKTQHFPDPQLQKQFQDVGQNDEGNVIAERSALFVFSPSVSYGTRTNTVILVDLEGNCDYIERTLETPVNVEQPHWTTVKYSFKLEEKNSISGSEQSQ